MIARSQAAVLLLALATGCAKVQTSYRAPQLEAPSRWSHGASEAAPGLEQTAWWKGFSDSTLDSLMERAVKGSLDLEQARARILQARADLGTSEAARWPTANATAGVNRSKSSANATEPGLASGASTLYQAGFDATWEADLFGGQRQGQEAAQARLEASVEDLGDVTLTLLAEVAGAYVALRGSQTSLGIARQNLESQQQTAEVTAERFRLGLTSYLDVAQAKALVATTRSDLPPFEASIQRSVHRLGILVGMPPRALAVELAPVKPLPSAQGVLATGLPSELLARRPDLRRAERRLKAAMADVGVAKAELYPKFDLTLGFGLQSLQTSNFASLGSRYGSIVPGLSLPIFNRGKLHANVASKEGLYQEKLAAFRASYQTALEDVENALVNYYAEKTRHQSLTEALAQDQEAVALATERYRLGLTTFLEVLTAQKALYAAQTSVGDSVQTQLTDLIALHKALGGGWKAI